MTTRPNHYLNIMNQTHPIGFKVATWYQALLVPNNIILDHMGTLEEFRKNGGKVLGYDQ